MSFGIACRNKTLSIRQFMPLHQVTGPFTIQRLLRSSEIRGAQGHANTLATASITGHETLCTALFGSASLWKNIGVS
jgi:hypothetical protein